jgi:hypothetical protein
MDVSSGVPPKQFFCGEWFVSIALLTGIIWVICDAAGLGTWWSAGVAFVGGFMVRTLALYRGWEEPLAKAPAGVYKHGDGRPLLGSKIAGKSQRELRDLGPARGDPDLKRRRLGGRNVARRFQEWDGSAVSGEPVSLDQGRPIRSG